MINGKLTPSIIEDLKNKGFNQSQIAEMWGVTRQYVSMVKHSTNNFSKTPREVVWESFPWGVVGRRFSRSTLYLRLMDHGEFRATGGKGMSVDSLRRLRTFYKTLQEGDLVVVFDPSIPPGQVLTRGRRDTVGGFAYVPREDTDGHLIIRVNEFATMTPQAEVIWEFPPSWPDVD